MKSITKYKTLNQFEKIKEKLESQKEEEKVTYFKDNLEILINRINKLYFSKLKRSRRIENSFDRYSKVKRRMDRKLHQIKKLRKNKEKFFTVENNLSSNINRNIDNLIFTIQKNYNFD